MKFLPSPSLLVTKEAMSNPSSSLQILAQMITTSSFHRHPSLPFLLRSLPLPLSLPLLSLLPNPSAFHFNTLLLRRPPPHPLSLLRRMLRLSVPFDLLTFPSLFPSLPSHPLSVGPAHCLFLKLFPLSSAPLSNPLLRLYISLPLPSPARSLFRDITLKNAATWTLMLAAHVRFGDLDSARRTLDEMPHRNVVAFTSLISGYSSAGRPHESLSLFRRMLSEGVAPDAVAVVAALSACARLRDLETGTWVRRVVQERRIGVEGRVAVALIDMYAKCGDVESARRVFDSLRERDRLPAAWNAMIHGYCRTGEVDEARSVFDRMESRDIVTFNSMITGYVQHSRLDEAILLLAEVRASGLPLDRFTVVGLLTACAGSGSISLGRTLHAYVVLSALDVDSFLGTALVDMYSKCGKMDAATQVFRRMKGKDVLTWTALVSGLAMNGKAKLALEHFSSMVREGVKPNAVAYIGVLNACSHSGLLSEARQHFEEMRTLHGLEPEVEHYGCMVDLLGRCGRLKEAEAMIRGMPMGPNAVIWGSLLHACRVHRDMGLAEEAAKHVLELEPGLDAGYVQLYNIYMDSGRHADASKIRRLMEARGVKKVAGYSSIVIGGKAHKFVAGDRSHPESTGIEETMREIARRLKAAGYSPMIAKVSVEMDEEEKEQALFGHSERMAIAFGIMKLGGTLPIHVVKNLRVCDDCHYVIKLISKIWSRDIVVRDRSRFHHFRDGQCSCNDFW